MRLAPALAGGAAPARWGMVGGLDIVGITADSRAVAPGFLFAALPGSQVDGRRFISDAVSRGAVAVLALEGTEWPAGVPPRPLLEDPEPRRLLAELAAGLAGVQRFTDDELARKEGLPGMILPGNMSAALIGKLVGDWARESRSKLVRLGTTYRSPVLPERNLTLQGFVTQVDHGQHTVELDIWIENEDGDRLVTATATVQFPS